MSTNQPAEGIPAEPKMADRPDPAGHIIRQDDGEFVLISLAMGGEEVGRYPTRDAAIDAAPV